MRPGIIALIFQELSEKNETVLFGDDSTPPSSTSSAAATATGNQFTFRALSDPSDELCSDIRLSASHGKRNCEEGWWRETGGNEEKQSMCIKI